MPGLMVLFISDIWNIFEIVQYELSCDYFFKLLLNICWFKKEKKQTRKPCLKSQFLTSFKLQKINDFILQSVIDASPIETFLQTYQRIKMTSASLKFSITLYTLKCA